MTDSLSAFFSSAREATLNDCDREQVHLCGAVQSVCGLIAVDRASRHVVAITQGGKEVLGAKGESAIGRPLAESHEALAAAIDDLEDDDPAVHHVIEGEFQRDEEAVDCIGHVSGSLWLLEFLPQGELSMAGLRSHVRKVGRDAIRIVNAPSVNEAQQLTCNTIRALTGAHRVDVYQFLDDWSGHVVAESKSDDVPGFLGLHFPASDIPQQARALYELIPYRAIASADDKNDAIEQLASLGGEPIDLSRSIVRSVSPMHTAYLRNMGVGSSFSLGLRHDNKLWGLIACHWKTQALPAFDLWSLARELGNALIGNLASDDLQRSAAKVMELREIERALSGEVRKRSDLHTVMSSIGPSLLRLLNADGFAFKYGDAIETAGSVPPEHFVRELVDWLPQHLDEDRQFRTSALHKDWPRAAEFTDTACGVLIQPVRPNRMYYMIWFRAPHSEVIHWAGEPQDKFVPAPPGTVASIEPRASFGAWRSEHSDASAPWTRLEEQAASDSLREVLTVIAELLALEEENVTLRSFAAAAAHDIKAPLRGIDFALSVMEEEDFDPAAVREFHDIATLSSSRLSDLTAGLMRLTTLQRDQIPRTPVDLNTNLTEIESLLVIDIKQSGASLHVSDLPSVSGDRALLQSLFLNLVGNAIKYRREGVSPEVHIDCTRNDDDSVDITVRDNGIGIPADSVDSIFTPLVRLHTKQEFEGSGLGLSICSRIVELHGGAIRAVAHEGDGALFVVTLLK